MGRPATELRDMRTLERPSMYAIFAPLDADEPLPRELLMDARRHRSVGRREMAGLLWLPLLCGVLLLAAWADLPTLPVLGLIAASLAALAGFAFYERRGPAGRRREAK
jgi:hypothetical protein